MAVAESEYGTWTVLKGDGYSSGDFNTAGTEKSSSKIWQIFRKKEKKIKG